MTALDVPGFGLFEGGRSASLRGRWALVPGGTAETRPHRGPLALAAALAPWRRRSVTMPLLSGALVVNEPVHLTVGEIAVAVDKTRSVRLTLAEVTALGNRRYAVDVIASALGPDAGPDETIRLEGTATRVRDGALRISLTGLAPTALIPGPTSHGPTSRGAASSSSTSSGSTSGSATSRGTTSRRSTSPSDRSPSRSRRPASRRAISHRIVFAGPFSPGSLLYGSLLHGPTSSASSATPAPSAPQTSAIPDTPPTGALIVSPTRGAGFRLKLIATFAR